jgi:hypothetical protein
MTVGYLHGVRDTLARTGLVRREGPGFLAIFAFGAGIGLIAGAAAALLVTPSTGREMRHEIGWRAKKLAQRTQGAMSNVKGRFAGAKDEAAGRFEERRQRNESPLG